MSPHPLLEELQWRGLLHQQTDGLSAALSAGTVSGYAGFDPTAPSLHVGNLVPVMGLVHLQRHGHRPVFLAGGGTGLIGDPSGKSSERQLLSQDEIAENTRLISRQLERFVDTSGKNAAVMENNATWLTPLKAIDFMRDVGKHFTVNYMMQKDSVKSRLESGVSYTEFSYMLLQAYDFLELHQRHGVTLQVGGSDQFGNITAGIELLRRAKGVEAHALTFPLVTNADGSKFGKSVVGAIWLDPKRTSPYHFYQYWMSTDDRDVGKLLRYFTISMSEAEIVLHEGATRDTPEARLAQRRLAREVTSLVHGPEALSAAEEVSTLLFGKLEPTALSPSALTLLEQVIPTFVVADGPQISTYRAIDAICTGDYALFKSKSQARQALDQGGLYFNGVRVTADQPPVTKGALLLGRYLLVRKGARSYGLVKLGA